MTSQKDQIQALIADIDGVLQRSTTRLPWVMSGEATQQRQMLERVRNYLVALQRRSAIQEGSERNAARPDLLAHDFSYQSPQASQPIEPFQGARSSPMSAQQMLETVIQEMGYLRASLLHPLQAELDALQQQREQLRREVEQLEAQRLSYNTSQLQANQQQMIAEFLHILMGRLQDTLSQQVAQALKNSNPSLPAKESSMLASSGSAIAPVSTDLVPHSYSPPLGQSPLQPASDPLVIKLDSTLKSVFESLERNVQAYQESLAQGLERMHNLGHQGEVMFTGLVNQLTQQPGQEPSTHLQPTESAANSLPQQETAQPSPPHSPPVDAPPPALHPTPHTPSEENLHPQAAEDSSDLKLPYPGAELPPQALSETAQSDAEPLSDASVDAAIDAWLRSARGDDKGTQLEGLGLENLDLPNLNLTDLELSQLEAGEDTAEIDAALKLLEQLTGELEVTANLSLEETEAEIDRMLTSSNQPTKLEAESGEAEPGQIVNDAQNELDEFYELFGKDAIPADLVDETELTSTWQPSPPQTAAAHADLSTENGAELFPFAGTEGLIVNDPTVGWDVVAPPPPANLKPAIPVATEAGRSQEPKVATPAQLANRQDDIPSTIADPIEVSDLAKIAASVEIPTSAETADLAAMTDPLSKGSDSPAVADLETGGIDEINALTDLLAETSLDQQTQADLAAIISSAGGPPATDAATQELFNQTLGWNVVPSSPPPPEVPPSNPIPAPGTDPVGDHYVPAAPEEDLMPTAEANLESDGELWVDETTLSRLNEDLFNLEQTDELPAQPPAQEWVNQPDPMLADWGAEESSLPDATPEAAATLASWNLEEPSPPISTAASQQSPADQREPTLEELAASLLNEPSSLVTPPAPSETETPATTPTQIASTQSDTDFTLVGMDDLFADVPATAPPVSSVPPPASTGFVEEESAAFTLEGMGDLFGDLPPAPSVNPAPPPGETLVPEEPIAPQPEISPPPPEQPIAAQPDDSPLTAPKPGTPVAPSPVASSQPPTFTWEGISDLFADIPTPVAPNPTTAQPSPPAQPSVFTLEEAENLFADTAPVSSPSPVVSSFSQPVGFTLEGLDDLFADTPAAPEPEPEAEPSMSALPEPPTDFTLTQVEDLFMEVPSQEAEIPGTGAFGQPDDDDDLTLEQAFESLMGGLSDSSPPTSELLDLETPASPQESVGSAPQTFEKKKKAY
ncbi:hypothetical protein K9N68_05590 [Kovacikia minuta CCNUW1]|uniref:hypothetical protein n=1 Tax=Kovacikia minuta TaxID=2931930 RepID=UPI001CCB490D|nr:hypothetical protein [Kovacikia minuta]UBF27421.1 hypothetical protein K9N68_05590 [Kovacikia minuta CCNUW1]